MNGFAECYQGQHSHVVAFNVGQFVEEDEAQLRFGKLLDHARRKKQSLPKESVQRGTFDRGGFHEADFDFDFHLLAAGVEDGKNLGVSNGLSGSQSPEKPGVLDDYARGEKQQTRQPPRQHPRAGKTESNAGERQSNS